MRTLVVTCHRFPVHQILLSATSVLFRSFPSSSSPQEKRRLAPCPESLTLPTTGLSPVPPGSQSWPCSFFHLEKLMFSGVCAIPHLSFMFSFHLLKCVCNCLSVDSEEEMPSPVRMKWSVLWLAPSCLLADSLHQLYTFQDFQSFPRS